MKLSSISSFKRTCQPIFNAKEEMKATSDCGIESKTFCVIFPYFI